MQTVVCFGDSITEGEVSANYVKMLEKRLGPKGFRFVNAGVNGDLSYNLLRRVDQVVALQPDYVTMMVGTNDVNASFRWIGQPFYFVWKGLPQKPNLDWYHENVTHIVRRLKAETPARIALCSIPPIGEDLASLPNQRVNTCNTAIKKIAEQEQVAYLPTHERLIRYLRTHGSTRGKPYNGDLLLTGELVVRRLIFKERFTTISRDAGFYLLTDGVHLNECGARIIAAEIEKFLLASLAEKAVPKG